MRRILTIRSVAAFISRRAPFRLLVLLVTAVASPATADVFDVSSRAGLRALSFTDQIGADNTLPEHSDFSAFNESITAESEGGRARASQNTTITQSTESLRVLSRGDTDISHEHTLEDRQFTGAGGFSFVSVFFCVDERSSFSVSGTLSVQTNGNTESSNSTFDFADVIAAEVEDARGFPRSTTVGKTGVLDPGCYGIDATSSSSLGDTQSASRTSFTFTVDVASSPDEPDGDVFRWIGPVLGTFGDEGNWDPTGVPAFIADTRSDTALFQGVNGVHVDIAALAALTDGTPGVAVRNAAAGPTVTIPQCSGVITRTIGRLVLDGARGIEFENGTLALDASSLDERALTIENKGELDLRNGAICARHAAIGASGRPSFALVAAPGVLQTLGRLSVGLEGEGTLRIIGGGIASSQEVRIGDGQARGRAVLSNATWTTGNIAVGFQSAGDLTVDNAGLLESETAVVDFDLPTGSPPQQPNSSPLCLGRTNAGGAIVNGAGSTWKLNVLDVGGRGCVNVTGQGHLDAVSGAGGAGDVLVGTDTNGEGSLLVADGGVVDTEGGMVIGDNGPGRLVIAERFGQDTRVDVEGTMLIGRFQPGAATGGHGLVIVSGDPGTDEFSLVANAMRIPDGAAARGELRIDFGGRVLNSTTAEVGTDGIGSVELSGADLGTPEQITTWQVSDTLTIGSDGMQTTGIVIIKDAGIQVGTQSTPGHVIIQKGGEVFGTGNRINLIRTFGGLITNHGKISGPVTLDGRYDPASTGSIVQAFAAPPAAPLQSAFLLGGAPRLAKAPAFPQGPVVFTGDAELAGTLVLQFLNGFAPKQGGTVPVFEVGGQVIGSFDEVQIVGLAPGATFDGVDDGTATALADTVALPVVTLKAPKKVKEKLGGKAKVQLKRTGDVTQPLSIQYALGGTATNGLDYATLPGVLEIPAGKKSATFFIRAFADGIFEGLETIEIEVLPGVDYAPAIPAKASVQLLSSEKKTK